MKAKAHNNTKTCSSFENYCGKTSLAGRQSDMRVTLNGIRKVGRLLQLTEQHVMVNEPLTVTLLPIRLDLKKRVRIISTA
jgi:hypothetical protein